MSPFWVRTLVLKSGLSPESGLFKKTDFPSSLPLFMTFFVLHIFIFVYEKIFLFSCIGRLCDYKISCYAERLKEAEGKISFICLMKKMFQIFFCIYSRQTGLTNRNDLLTLLSYPLN